MSGLRDFLPKTKRGKMLKLSIKSMSNGFQKDFPTLAKNTKNVKNT